MEHEAREAIDASAGERRYIHSCDHSPYSRIPIENVIAILRAEEEHGTAAYQGSRRT